MELAEELEPCYETIRNWVRQATAMMASPFLVYCSREGSAAQVTPGEPPTQAWAGDPGKSRGLVRLGGRLASVFGFGMVL